MHSSRKPLMGHITNDKKSIISERPIRLLVQGSFDEAADKLEPDGDLSESAYRSKIPGELQQYRDAIAIGENQPAATGPYTAGISEEGKSLPNVETLSTDSFMTVIVILGAGGQDLGP